MLSHNDVHVKLIDDEAEAVLHILGKRVCQLELVEADWRSLFISEGYIRLKQREESDGRIFEDADFKVFMLSDELLGRHEILSATLSTWLTIDCQAAVGRALAYLPSGTPVRANIYPVIKLKTNSFVSFDKESDPAILLYLDPQVTPKQLVNILAHELHHIGLGSAQADLFQSEEWKGLRDPYLQMLKWVGAFGEGIAMLAAAGGPDTHPHVDSKPEDRARWDRDLLNFEADFRQVEAFLHDVASGKLEGQAMLEKGVSFFGIQGPWYTVGWKMAVTIEKNLGRETVVAAFCNPRRLLATYNRAAGDELPKWSEDLTN